MVTTSLKRSRRTVLRRLLFSCTMMLVYASFASATAQEKVNVRTISSQTADSVAFKISVAKSSYVPNQNITIDYTVTNKSKKVAYLVVEAQPRPTIDEKKRFITVHSPVKNQTEWNRYDNDLISIVPGRSFSGKLLIEGSKVPVNQRSESESWEIQVVFGYVLAPAKGDIEELLACKDTAYSFPCLGKLYDLAKILTVGNLVVEVKSR